MIPLWALYSWQPAKQHKVEVMNISTYATTFKKNKAWKHKNFWEEEASAYAFVKYVIQPIWRPSVISVILSNRSDVGTKALEYWIFYFRNTPFTIIPPLSRNFYTIPPNFSYFFHLFLTSTTFLLHLSCFIRLFVTPTHLS